MKRQLTNQELVERVKRLLSGHWGDDDMEQLFSEISENVPCPFSEIQGFIFHSPGLTPEQMVEAMLAYEVITPPPPSK